jgi:hypothetical protein
MPIDAWGIDKGYEDAEGNWHTIDPDVVTALRQAMGGDSLAKPRRDVQIVQQGSSPATPSGKLRLEDGTELAIKRAGRLPPDLPIGYHDLQPADTLTCAARRCRRTGGVSLPVSSKHLRKLFHPRCLLSAGRLG